MPLLNSGLTRSQSIVLNLLSNTGYNFPIFPNQGKEGSDITHAILPGALVFVLDTSLTLQDFVPKVYVVWSEEVGERASFMQCVQQFWPRGNICLTTETCRFTQRGKDINVGGVEVNPCWFLTLAQIYGLQARTIDARTRIITIWLAGDVFVCPLLCQSV